MCSISGSFNYTKLAELIESNRYRGQFSHSIFVFDRNSSKIIYHYKDKGPIDLTKHCLPDGYCVVHQQAPTSQSTDNIHPAVFDSNFLWHNGIITNSEIQKMQKKYETDETWDTKLLLYALIEKDTLSDIIGSFACVWYNGKINIFRNMISPLFLDNDLTISSTKFKHSRLLEPGKIFQLDLNLKRMSLQTNFETHANNPYFLGVYNEA